MDYYKNLYNGGEWWIRSGNFNFAPTEQTVGIVRKWSFCGSVLLSAASHCLIDSGKLNNGANESCALHTKGDDSSGDVDGCWVKEVYFLAQTMGRDEGSRPTDSCSAMDKER